MRVVLTGSGVNPTLDATLGNANDNGGTTITPKLIGIETINVAFTGSGANAVNELDLQDSPNTGNTINITRVSDGIGVATIDNIGVASENLSVANSGQPDQFINFAFKNSALSGDDDETTLTVQDVQVAGIAVESRLPTAGIGFETINLVSKDEANSIGVLLAEDLETLNISGNADLTLGDTDTTTNARVVEAIRYGAGLDHTQGSLSKIDASDFEGNLDITLAGDFNAPTDGTSGVNTALTVIGGKGDDIFRVAADVIGATDLVDGGEGDNTMVLLGNTIVNPNGAAATVKNVQNLEVRTGHDVGVAADLDNIDADAFDSLANIYVRNEGQDNGGAAAFTTAYVYGLADNVLYSGTGPTLAAALAAANAIALAANAGNTANPFVTSEFTPEVPAGDWASAAEGMTVTLNNLTSAQANNITLAHGTTGNSNIANNILNINLKDATGAADAATVTIVDGVNNDPRFNFQVQTNVDDPLTTAVERIENLTFADNDTESNSIYLINPNQNTGTITFTGGQTGKYMNMDANGPNGNGLSGYGLFETGALGSNAQVAGVLLATRDEAVNSAIQNIDYRVLYNDTAGRVADVRLIAENITAADYASDLIVRLGDVTRTDGFSSQSIVGGSGNDTFIFDAQGVKNSGYTSGDTVKAGTGTDTLVIDGNTTAAKADGSAGVGGHISVQKSEWDNTSGIDILRLAGNQGMANISTTSGLLTTRVAADLSVSSAGYYIEIDDDFVHQTDAGNNLTIINNDGDLSVNSESDLVLNLRDLAQTSNVTFIGANGNAVSAGLVTISSNRIQLADKSANGLNHLDGGDTDVTDTLAIGNNNVLHIFNSADVSIHDLSNTKNFSLIEFENDLAIAQTMKLTLNNTVVDALVDASHTATTTQVETLFIRAIDNTLVAGATANLNVDASIVGAQFSLDIIGGGGTDIIVAGAGNDIITGGVGADVLTGGAGTNTFVFAAGDTTDAAGVVVPSTTFFDTITDWRAGTNNVIDFGGAAVVGFQNVAAAAGVATVGAGGLLTFNAADSTFAQHLTAAEAALNGSAAGETVIWQEGADAFIFIDDGAAGVTANDVLIKLTGVTVGAGGLTFTAGDITAIA